MASNHVDTLQTCPKDDKEGFTCLGYVLVKNQEMDNRIDILWACHHGGFKRTTYEIPSPAAKNTAGWV